MLKAERPPVTPAAHCERAPTQTRRCLSSWDHNTTMELWFQITNLAWGLGQRSPCDAGPAGPALRQTETLGGGQSTHLLSGGGSDKHRGQRLIGAALEHRFAFLTAEFGFEPQPTTAISVQRGFQRAAPRGKFCA